MSDRAMTVVSRPSCARVLVDIDMRRPSPSRLLINMSDDRCIQQAVLLENRPDVCSSCFHRDHDIGSCPRSIGNPQAEPRAWESVFASSSDSGPSGPDRSSHTPVYFSDPSAVLAASEEVDVAFTTGPHSGCGTVDSPPGAGDVSAPSYGTTVELAVDDVALGQQRVSAQILVIIWGIAVPERFVPSPDATAVVEVVGNPGESSSDNQPNPLGDSLVDPESEALDGEPSPDIPGLGTRVPDIMQETCG
ncbi:uncharacterized protein M6B38_374615 [Iris pallida]|uniref:Uncharacterized protein n=1 Tax=Iris pallida TaxID=29817 RepID=A0AAX6GB25_IRIPA|nr:uncharacterized protein M6B38_374615 [Iris pallida]